MLLILLSNLLAGSVHCASVNEISKEYKSKFTNAEWDGNPTACVVKPHCYSHQKSNCMRTLKKGNEEKMLQLRATFYWPERLFCFQFEKRVEFYCPYYAADKVSPYGNK